MDNLSDKLQSIASEIYALEDEQRYTREKQHNYKNGSVFGCYWIRVEEIRQKDYHFLLFWNDSDVDMCNASILPVS